MKVWELIALLEKSPAGAEVFVSSGQTLWSKVTDAELQEENLFGISCDDFEVINEGGDNIGWLSEIAEPKE